jgi:subtilase family serine protease
LPDLTTRSNVSVGIADDGSAILSFEITNSGKMAAPSAQVQITTDGQTSSIHIMSTGPLGIGEAISLQSGALPGEGRHHIDVRIDPLGLIPEADQDNNSLVFLYTIGPMAELVVTAISLEPDPFTFGELLTLEFAVANQGGKKSEATTAQIYDPVAAVLLGTVTIPVVEPGEQHRITFQWTVETALTSVKIVLDPGLLIDEEDEDNNTSVLTLSP